MKRYEILIGFLLATALWAVIFVLQSDASLLHQICETNQYTEHENCSPHHPLYVALYYIEYAINPVTLGAAATVAIAVFTYTLYEATKGLVKAAEIQSADMKQSIAAAQMAANAADLSARASIGVQLPILRVNPEKLCHGEHTSGTEIIEECSVYSVTVWNLGSTKAFPKEVLYGWAIGEELPPEPKYQFTSAFDIHSIIVPNGTAFIKGLSGVKLLKSGEWSRICGGNYLWFYCCIIYDDFMDETRSHGFCWKWASTGMGVDWRVEKAAAYNKKNAALSEPPQYP